MCSPLSNRSLSRPERRGHYGAEPAHRHPLRLRAGRELQAGGLDEVPRRRGDGAQGYGECGCPGQGQVDCFVLLLNIEPPALIHLTTTAVWFIERAAAMLPNECY